MEAMVVHKKQQGLFNDRLRWEFLTRTVAFGKISIVWFTHHAIMGRQWIKNRNTRVSKAISTTFEINGIGLKLSIIFEATE